MKLLSAVNQWELVGYRFVRLLIDEGAVSERSGEIELAVQVRFSSMGARELKSGQTVHELFVQVVVERGGGESAAEELIDAKVVAGFVHRSMDGDVDVPFHDVLPQAVRSIYWLARQRVHSLLSLTKLRTLPIDWDLDLRDAPQLQERVAGKREIKAKPVAKASSVLRDASTGKSSKSAAGSALSRRSPSKQTSKPAAAAASSVLRDGQTSAAPKSAAASVLSPRLSKKK
jgi:hypothetical protein